MMNRTCSVRCCASSIDSDKCRLGARQQATDAVPHTCIHQLHQSEIRVLSDGASLLH